jgi:thiol:disulfide interchange protein DsbA
MSPRTRIAAVIRELRDSRPVAGAPALRRRAARMSGFRFKIRAVPECRSGLRPDRFRIRSPRTKKIPYKQEAGMMKPLFALLAGLLLFSATTHAEETAGAFKEGVDYDLVQPAQPTADPAKVEVMEFFWYGCPHCYDFEPAVNAWLQRKPDNVLFIRQPAAFNELWAAHAKAFFTAEALGILDKVHAPFYEAIQKKKQHLETEDQVAKFLSQYGVPEAEVRKAYKSFAVDAKMRRATGGQGDRPLTEYYRVDGTPAIIVNGKYRIGPRTAKSFPRMIEIMEALIKKESGGEKKPAT